MALRSIFFAGRFWPLDHQGLRADDPRRWLSALAVLRRPASPARQRHR
jgi:hypothetical protein